MKKELRNKSERLTRNLTCVYFNFNQAGVVFNWAYKICHPSYIIYQTSWKRHLDIVVFSTLTVGYGLISFNLTLFRKKIIYFRKGTFICFFHFIKISDSLMKIRKIYIIFWFQKKRKIYIIFCSKRSIYFHHIKSIEHAYISSLISFKLCFR